MRANRQFRGHRYTKGNRPKKVNRHDLRTRHFRIYDGTTFPDNVGSYLSFDITSPDVNWHHCDEDGNRTDEVTGYFRIVPEWPNLFSGTSEILDGIIECLSRYVNDGAAVDNHEEPYSDDMPGMTLDEFQAWSDEIIKEAKGE